MSYTSTIWENNREAKDIIIRECTNQLKAFKNGEGKMNWIKVSVEIKKEYGEFHSQYLKGPKVSQKLKPIWTKYIKEEKEEKIEVSIQSPKINTEESNSVILVNLEEKHAEIQVLKNKITDEVRISNELKNHLEKVTGINKDVMASNLQMETELYQLRTEISDLNHFHESEKIKLMNRYSSEVPKVSRVYRVLKNGDYELYTGRDDGSRQPFLWVGVFVLIAGICITTGYRDTDLFRRKNY